uniref:Glycosyltransferase 2-like domain-containing protein n=1 Tax=viral metagenome TaxID=1070528 RepID=A0A6C0JXZ3_9ZZZZ
MSTQREINYPLVSVITPTYNRRTFIPSLIACFRNQSYPKDRMEWIVLDDGTDSVEDLFKAQEKALPMLRYIRNDEKQLIGAKRNRLNKEAKGQIIVAMDDDDYYPPERVSHVVTKFKQYPGIELAGSSEIYMYYTDIKMIYKLGPYDMRHATNGTMAWRKSYALKNTYDETVTHAEEKSFLESYKNPMIQLDPLKVMLVISHSENTFNKVKMREDPNNPFVKKTPMKIRDFIKEAGPRKFYSELH